jgi:hypothetical protein
MKILKLFPILGILYTIDKTKGVSISEANRRKTANTNESEKILRTLRGTVYETVVQGLTTKGWQADKAVGKISKVDPTTFIEKVEQVVANNVENASLGQLKYIATLRERLEQMEMNDLALKMEVEIPQPAPYDVPEVKQVLLMKKNQYNQEVHISIDEFCAMPRVENMLRVCSQELIDRITKEHGNIFGKMLKNEAISATYGKQLDNGSFIRNLMNAEEVVDKGTTGDYGLKNMFINKYQRLAYDKADFEGIEDEMKKRRDEMQNQRNGHVAIIKTAARTLQMEYINEHKKAQEKYSAKVREYNTAQSEYVTQMNALRQELLKELLEIKVVV